MSRLRSLLRHLSTSSLPIIHLMESNYHQTIPNHGMERIKMRIRCSGQKIRSVVRLIIMLTASIGFSIQVLNVTTQYFRYTTRAQINIERRQEVPEHNVALCFIFEDIIKHKSIRNLTVRQLFDMSPEPETIFSSCGFREPDASFTREEDMRCNRIFRVKRYVTIGRMCYRFSPRNRTSITVRDVTLSMTSPFAMFKAHLNEKLSRVNSVNSLVFEGRLSHT